MDVKYHETSKVAELVDIYNQTKAEVGVGFYNGGIKEIQGIGNADNPLYAEHSEKPCLYYEASVERKYEVTEEQRDKDGNYRTVTTTKTEQISNNIRRIPFYLDDGSGERILVDMEGAKVDAQPSFDRFEAEAPAGFNISNWGANSRTLGYSYKEKIVPLKAKLYVLGEFSDRRGEISIIKPTEKDKHFIVSTKSEEEIIKSAESSASWQYYGAITSVVIGLITIIVSLFA